MEASSYLPIKFGYKLAYYWKVINPNRVLQVNFHIWPHLTCDLLMWPLTPEYHGHQPTNFGYKLAYYWKVINPNRVLQVNFHIWPLTYLHDLHPHNIVEANIEHLPTKFGYKQAYSWKVINHNIVLQVSYHIWPHLTYTYMTFDPKTSLALKGPVAAKLFKFLFGKRHGRRTDRRNLDPLVSPPPRWARQNHSSEPVWGGR